MSHTEEAMDVADVGENSVSYDFVYTKMSTRMNVST